MNRYDVVVVEPFLDEIKQKVFFKNCEPNVPNLRLIYFLKNIGLKVKFIDLKHDQISFKELISYINSANLMMIDIKSYNFLLSEKLVSNAKTEIFVYSQLPSSLPQLFSSKYITFIGDISNLYLLFFSKWKGRERISIQEFINTIKKFAKNNKIQLNYDEKKLDYMPYVDIEEIKKRNYHVLYPYKHPILDNLFRKRFGYLSLTFGCPFDCIFCSPTLRISTGKKVIHFSIKNALFRIKRLYNAGFEYIRFMDDEFTLDHKFVKALLKEIIKEKLPIKFTIQTRLTSLDDELLGLLKQAGAYLLCLGFESASDKVLKVLKKGQKLSDLKRGFEMIKKHNLRFVSYFMIGSPNETLNDVKKSINFSLKMHPDVFQLAFFTIYPGSPIFSNIVKRDSLKISTKMHYRGFDLNLSKIPKKTLKRVYWLWYLKYYLFNFNKLNRIFSSLLLFKPEIILLRIKNFLRAILH